MYRKVITPAFEQDGRRKRLVGQLAELYDGEILLYSQVHDCNVGQAEQILDDLVYELLSDQAEHGLVDDVAAALETEGVSSHQIPSWAEQHPICADPTCNGAHHIQSCPHILAHLFAPESVEPIVLVLDVDYAPAGWSA